MRTNSPPPPAVIGQLSSFFERNGYVRFRNGERLEKEGPQLYKKGDEVRLVASSEAELRIIQRLLSQAGFTPGRPFVKGNQLRVPLYGREAVERFLSLVAAAEKQPKPSR